MHGSTFALKKDSTPDPLQLLRDQDPARYPIIILIETIKDLYVSDYSAIAGRRKRARGHFLGCKPPTGVMTIKGGTAIVLAYVLVSMGVIRVVVRLRQRRREQRGDE